MEVSVNYVKLRELGWPVDLGTDQPQRHTATVCLA